MAERKRTKKRSRPAAAGFISIPVEWLAHPKLAPASLLVAGAIKSLVRLRKRPVAAEEVAAFIGWPVRNVQRGAAELLREGIAERSQSVEDARAWRYEIRATSGAYLEDECSPDVASKCSPDVASKCSPDLTEVRAGSGEHLDSDTVLPEVKIPPGGEWAPAPLVRVRDADSAAAHLVGLLERAWTAKLDDGGLALPGSFPAPEHGPAREGAAWLWEACKEDPRRFAQLAPRLVHRWAGEDFVRERLHGGHGRNFRDHLPRLLKQERDARRAKIEDREQRAKAVRAKAALAAHEEAKRASVAEAARKAAAFAAGDPPARRLETAEPQAAKRGPARVRESDFVMVPHTGALPTGTADA